jgi:hypothetical protein
MSPKLWAEHRAAKVSIGGSLEVDDFVKEIKKEPDLPGSCSARLGQPSGD